MLADSWHKPGCFPHVVRTPDFYYMRSFLTKKMEMHNVMTTETVMFVHHRLRARRQLAKPNRAQR